MSTTPIRTYPKTCFTCETEIGEPVYEFGGRDDVLCQSCYLELLEGEEKSNEPFDYFEKFLVVERAARVNAAKPVLRKDTFYTAPLIEMKED